MEKQITPTKYNTIQSPSDKLDSGASDEESSSKKLPNSTEQIQ